MSAILFTDADGTWKLHNGKVWPATRFQSWTPDSLPFGDAAHALADGALTRLRLRDDFSVTFELPLIPSLRSSNGIVRAEALDHASWIKSNSVVVADASPAPDGSPTADKLRADNAAAVEHYIDFPALPPLLDSTFQVPSIFVAASDAAWIHLSTIDKAGVVQRTWFDLAGGRVATQQHPMAWMLPAGRNSAIVGTKMYHRCAVRFSSQFGGTTPRVVVGLATTDGNLVWNGDGISGVFLWGAQFDTNRSEMSPYLFTDTAARSNVSLVEIADRLKYHLLNGGTCSVYTNDAAASSYATCGLKPGTVPQLALSDRRSMEYTLSLQLVNRAASPTRMLAHYSEQ